MTDTAPRSLVQDGLAFERPLRELELKIKELRNLATGTHLELSDEIHALEDRLRKQTVEVYAQLSPWERVHVARHADRPLTSDYVQMMLDDFVELHGDRVFGDDRAILTGLATMQGQRFLLVGHRKGKTVKDRLACNFGCAHPEGYRKALQKMRLAEKLKLPIVTFINTPGAYPGIGAEERGQASAIAKSILEMFDLKVPVVCIVIGEGGSGGALGIGIGDRVGMLENSYYSVISPEGCAAILWKSGEKAPEAADALKLTSKDLLRFGLVDKVIEEPVGGAHRDQRATVDRVKAQVLEWLAELSTLPTATLLEQRYEKFRRMGMPLGS
ncbi:acetyl-coenzyme A carboxylase carboxyl transferase subunit alpha [Planctomycetota bacterium]|nr:acetyl-coenzyme A carboxylase carboxyl transferase subunit alpha [Planctomycetota bacterium]